MSEGKNTRSIRDSAGCGCGLFLIVLIILASSMVTFFAPMLFLVPPPPPSIEYVRQLIEEADTTFDAGEYAQASRGYQRAISATENMLAFEQRLREPDAVVSDQLVSIRQVAIVKERIASLGEKAQQISELRAAMNVP